MGFIDADCHGIETGTHTWEHFDPKEQEYAPPKEGPWMFEGGVHEKGLSAEQRKRREAELIARGLGVTVEFNNKFYPPGCFDLSNVEARMKHMDQLGCDVQIVFSNFWLIDPVQDPVREAAMARSWNRWAAEGTAPSKGRIKWMIKVPGRVMNRAFEELEFGAKHGAAGIELSGYKYNIAPGHPYWYPLYERAQDLNLCVAFHIGASQQDYAPNPKDTFYRTQARVPGAMASMLAYDVPKKFPKLRTAYIEAGTQWLPQVCSTMFRGKSDASQRAMGNDWRKMAKEYLAETDNMWAAAYMDDDIQHNADVAGWDRMMLGTDYTHLDIGSDPDGLRITARRKDLPHELKVKMLDINPRRCYGIPSDFRPADTAAREALAGVA